MNLCQCSFSEEHKDIYKYFFNHFLIFKFEMIHHVRITDNYFL